MASHWNCYCIDKVQGDYVIGWQCDHHYRTSRLRFPRGHSMVTDEKGAKRFCKKHGLVFVEGGKATYA